MDHVHYFKFQGEGPLVGLGPPQTRTNPKRPGNSATSKDSATSGLPRSPRLRWAKQQLELELTEAGWMMGNYPKCLMFDIEVTSD